MIHKARPVRDPFTFSLGGMATIASCVAAPAVADDRINKAWDERLSRPKNDRGSIASLWFQSQGYIAQEAYA